MAKQRPANILVVDDNAIRTDVFGKETVLKNYNLWGNVSFPKFPCAQEAYKWMEDGNTFDMVLLDYRVPHDPNGRPESEVSQRFADVVANEHWNNDYQLLIALVTEDYATEEVENFAGDYAWDPDIHFHLFPYDGKKGDSWLSYLRKAVDFLEELQQGPLSPGKDVLHDFFQVQRVADELYEVWEENKERGRITNCLKMLRDHYLPSADNCEDIANTENQEYKQWWERAKPCIKQIETAIEKELGK